MAEDNGKNGDQAERDHELIVAINAGCGAVQVLASFVEGCRRSGAQLKHATKGEMRDVGARVSRENTQALRDAARHIEAACESLGDYCADVDIAGGMEDRHGHFVNAAFDSLTFAISDKPPTERT